MHRNYAVYLCGPSRCPTDPAFEHDNYFGCVPKDFTERTGRSKTHRQHKDADGRYRWDGGCDVSTLGTSTVPLFVTTMPDWAAGGER